MDEEAFALALENLTDEATLQEDNPLDTETVVRILREEIDRISG